MCHSAGMTLLLDSSLHDDSVGYKVGSLSRTGLYGQVTDSNMGRIRGWAERMYIRW